MQTNNGPDLSFGFVFGAYGVSIEIRTNRFGILADIENLLPPTSQIISNNNAADFLFSVFWDYENERISEFYRDTERQVCDGDFQHSLNLLESALRLTVAEFAQNLVFVHASVVAFDDSAIIIPGRSCSGKTTLTSVFVRHGAVYYSDEYAIFDESGFVHPFPKPLSVREPWADGRQVDYSVETFGGVQGTKPLKAKAVIVTEYEAGADWQPKRLSCGEGVLELLGNTVSARANPRLALKILPCAIENALILKGKRGDAEAVSKEIKKVLTKSTLFA